MKKKHPDIKESSESFSASFNFNACVYGPPEMLKKRAKEFEKQRKRVTEQIEKEKTSDTEKED